MKFKNDFPKNIEYILNKYNNVYFGGKMKKQTGYEFECWDEFAVHDTVARFKTKTASEMARKINALVIKLNKKQ